MDRHHIALAALKVLAHDGALVQARVEAAIARYGIDTGCPHPWDCRGAVKHRCYCFGL